MSHRYVFEDPYLFFDANKLSTPSVFVEVGSCTGEHARKLAANYDSRVIVYEASKRNFEKLADALAGTSVLLQNKAVMGKDGLVDFFEFQQKPSSSSVFERHLQSQKHVLQEKYQAAGVSMATVLSENKIEHIDVLFLNCEGAEIYILLTPA
jgi:FkbM family methyltransferase